MSVSGKNARRDGGAASKGGTHVVGIMADFPREEGGKDKLRGKITKCESEGMSMNGKSGEAYCIKQEPKYVVCTPRVKQGSVTELLAGN